MARNWQTVDGSTRIKAYEYDLPSHTLYVKFQPSKSGECDVFAYANVSPQKVQDFATSSSKGRWLNTEIDRRRDDHPFQRVGREPAEETTTA